MFFNTTPIGATVAAMDGYLQEKFAMGLLHIWPVSRAAGFKYERCYNNVQWETISEQITEMYGQPTRYFSAHAALFTDVLMPALHAIGVEHDSRIMVEPYCLQSNGETYWRLEVDKLKQRLGIWEFHPDLPIPRNALLQLKFTVLGVCDFMPGAWVDQ